MRTIQATVNPRLLTKANRLFTGTLEGRIIEILQNARRAGATQVNIMNLPDGLVLVRDPAVKSGRSLQIRTGAAAGKVCITPTRAAIEATEAYRQAHNMGRGGGITNGWEFWKPKT